MKFIPGLTNGIQDPLVKQLFEFVLGLLRSVLQYDLYKCTVTWHTPFFLDVPVRGKPRTTPPDVVRVGTARAVGTEQTPVHTGSVLWLWSSGGRVNILDVAGLVDGVKYELTFEVVDGK